jgi:Undecaprenyl-phosphate galactose phosphotransferase WbaP
MSQFDLSDASSPAAAGNTEASDDQAALAVTAPAAVLTRPPMASTFHQLSHSRSTLIQPAGSGGHELGAANLHRRRVGAQYLFQLALTTIPLIAIDLALLTLAIIAAREVVLFLQIGTGVDISLFYLPIATGFLLVATELGLYPGIRLSPVEEFRRIAVSITAMYAMWMVSIAISRGLTNQPVFLLLAYVFSMISLPVCRGTTRRILAKCSWWGFPTLVCGDDAVAVKVYHWLADNQRIGLRPVGVIADADAIGASADESWYAGPWSSAREIARNRGVYWAVVVPPEGANTTIAATVTEYLSTIPHIHILSELTGLPDHWSRHQQIDGLTGIHLQQNLLLPLPRMSKRILDIVLTLIGGLFLLPVLFYIAVAVKMSARGPVLYANDRIGRDGRRFRMWKFRSMFTNGDQVLEHYLDTYPEIREEYETTQKLKWDPRITRIGRFIRKTSLDELPQLWNVLKGDMSLVGPRPILLEEEAKYGDYYWLYTMVSPGITGLWQVSGRSNTSYEERLQLVAYYVRNWSLWLDIYLLWKTVRIVVFGRGAY